MNDKLENQLYVEFCKIINPNRLDLKRLHIRDIHYLNWDKNGLVLELFTGGKISCLERDQGLRLNKSIHYLQDLLLISRNGFRATLRSSYSCQNQYAHYLNLNNMCNAICMYRKSSEEIQMFNFIANQGDDQAMNRFLNNRNRIYSIVNNWQSSTAKLLRKKKYSPLKKQMFSKKLASSIFEIKDESRLEEAKLTKREKECFLLQNSGFDAKSIAIRLGIKLSTVRYYLHMVKQKMNILEGEN